MAGIRVLAELQSALRRELEVGEILDLEEDFYDSVRSWLASLSSAAKGSESESASILAERARETVKKLFLLRLIKELNYIWTHDSLPEKRLPKQEAAVLESILSTVGRVAGEVVGEREEESREAVKAVAPAPQRTGMMALVSFKKPHTKLVLSNGALLGPFLTGDIAIIPLSDAEALAKAGIVEVITSLLAGP